MYNNAAPRGSLRGCVIKRIWRLPTLPHVGAVPLAMGGLTSLFGMGRGEHPRQNHHKAVCVYVCMYVLSNKINTLGKVAVVLRAGLCVKEAPSGICLCGLRVIKKN